MKERKTRTRSTDIEIDTCNVIGRSNTLQEGIRNKISISKNFKFCGFQKTAKFERCNLEQCNIAQCSEIIKCNIICSDVAECATAGGSDFQSCRILSCGNFENCTFESCNFQNCNFESCSFENCIFQNCNLK